MSKYNTEEGVILDTEKAQERWSENTRWDGSNNISVATGSQWHHEDLYLSRKGNYYIESWSNIQGCASRAAIIPPKEAARWLLLNGHPLPKSLMEYEETIVE